MLKIFEDKAKLSKAAAELFVQKAQEAVKQNGRFTVALTGGSSPVQLYTLLAQLPYREQVPWEKTFVFWGDERWVPLTANENNARMAMEILLNKVPVPEDQVYPMWKEDTEPEAFAQQYEQLLQQHFGQQTPQFDLILLGMGDDGHTASLFPGTEVLHEQSRWVQAYYLEPQSMYRVTLTAPLINQAKTICFLTFGANKAPALHEVLEGERNPEKYPSQLIQPQDGEVVWLVDESAASQLAERY
ncbi:6-phosphogluconolactonase [Pontibacter diazotrophicus]|uniref:6-phosphogluconolactonase n=1 Tax=Pontibacter diazotrophicus TaxID=1400979 RepID=A0A3D8LHL9_9BACT|nr:6-phosphogluconolactonase [Pontibacter diazotrophicus]RDV16836.1 6-phosphogluconolactonase [Pontibacter diazotrophicus]